MTLDIDRIARIVSGVVADYDVLEAYLFGSYARGDQTESSDVDLRLLCGPSMTYGALYRMSERLEALLGCQVEIVTNPPEHMRPAFRERVRKEEVLLYAAA